MSQVPNVGAGPKMEILETTCPSPWIIRGDSWIWEFFLTHILSRAFPAPRGESSLENASQKERKPLGSWPCGDILRVPSSLPVPASLPARFSTLFYGLLLPSTANSQSVKSPVPARLWLLSGGSASLWSFIAASAHGMFSGRGIRDGGGPGN